LPQLSCPDKYVFTLLKRGFGAGGDVFLKEWDLGEEETNGINGSLSSGEGI